MTNPEPWVHTETVEGLSLGGHEIVVVIQGCYDIEAKGTRIQVDYIPAIRNPNK